MGGRGQTLIDWVARKTEHGTHLALGEEIRMNFSCRLRALLVIHMKDNGNTRKWRPWHLPQQRRGRRASDWEVHSRKRLANALRSLSHLRRLQPRHRPRVGVRGVDHADFKGAPARGHGDSERLAER